MKSPESNSQTPNVDYIKYSLQNVGVSVFVGIMTTKVIGVFVLLFAASKVFQIYYFRMYFFLIVVGFFHGFMLLPLFLTYVNIRSTESDKVTDSKFAQEEFPEETKKDDLLTKE